MRLCVCACALTEQDTLGFALPQDGFKYSKQGFRQLLLQVVLCVDGNGVLQHIDRVLQQHMVGPSIIATTGEGGKT